MKKEYLIMAGAFLVFGVMASAVYLAVIPRSGGLAPDMRFVQLDQRVPPFFDNIFRPADFKSKEFLINDPLTTVRGHPLIPEENGVGPHDLMGFRNRCIPAAPEIITIGDSLTYGNNAALDENWPGVMRRALGLNELQTYSMAVGGWGAVQYFDMFTKALAWRPRVVVVAFFTGNDALESFRDAYRMEAFKSLRPSAQLTIADLPPLPAGPAPDDAWSVRFKDGGVTLFTPRRRLLSNDRRSAVVRAGYEIMKSAAKRMDVMAAVHALKVLIVMIPTKELAFSARLGQEQIEPPPEFRALIENESANLADFAAALRELPHLRFLDVTPELQDECVKNSLCYPPDLNGHPLAAGYARIGKAVAAAAAPLLAGKPDQ